MKRLPKSRLGRVFLAILAVLLVTIVVLIGSTGWLDALGAAPKGERLARIQRSPNYRDGAFRNTDTTNTAPNTGTWEMLRRWLGGKEQRGRPGQIGRGSCGERAGLVGWENGTCGRC